MILQLEAKTEEQKLIKEYLENKLNEKNLPEKTESYKVIKGSKNLDDIEKGEI